MPVTLTVTFEPEIKPMAQREWHQLDVVSAPSGRPMKFIARLCCAHAHLLVKGEDIVTCCHAGHPSFMIRGDKVVGTEA